MSEIKKIRGQLRQIVKDLFPELVKEVQYEQLRREMHERMERIERNVKETMSEVNQRSKDTQSFLVRTVTKPAEAPKNE